MTPFKLVLILLLLQGCALVRPPLDTAALVAETAGLQPWVISTDLFPIQSFIRCGNHTTTLLTVYLEGDGLAWKSRQRPSSDPTPRNPVALRLAARDPAPNLLYLARPCQFRASPRCNSRYWTSARYSAEILAAVSLAVDAAKERCGCSQIELIGYSGGGAVAALLAESRDDIRFLMTVAANLDHEAWTLHHQVSALNHSLRPAADALAREKLAALPQLHVIGGRDQVVPETVIRSYLDKIGKAPLCRVEIINDFGHRDDWPSIWPSLLRLKEQLLP